MTANSVGRRKMPVKGGERGFFLLPVWPIGLVGSILGGLPGKPEACRKHAPGPRDAWGFASRGSGFQGASLHHPPRGDLPSPPGGRDWLHPELAELRAPSPVQEQL